jgi:hypothetical protein
MEIVPLAPRRLADAASLLESSPTTRGCWCMWFLLSSREAQAGWGELNRSRFTALAARDDPPAGLLAYQDGIPVGWCAMGPRSRYPRVLRSPLMAGRDPAEDDTVWFVPCFFVRRGARRAGLTAGLLGRCRARPELRRDGDRGLSARRPGPAYLGPLPRHRADVRRVRVQPRRPAVAAPGRHASGHFWLTGPPGGPPLSITFAVFSVFSAIAVAGYFSRISWGIAG